MLEDIGNLFHGFSVVLQPYNIALMVLGIVLGVIIGVLPGLGGANGIAILLPLTFSMSPTSAIIMLSCIYWGALFGGAITSVLFNIPGEPWSVATTFDGHPMAQQGKAGEALTAAFTSSFVGALFAVIMITLVAPLVAHVRPAVRAAEKFSVFFLAFCSFIGMGKEPPFKTIVVDDDRLRARRRRPRQRDRPAAPDLRLHRNAQRLRLPDRRHRPVRHRRDPADHGGGARLPGQGRGHQSEGGVADLEGAAALLDDVAALLPDRLLDGHLAGRRDAGLVHELRHRQARFAKRGHNFGKGEIEGVVAPETAAHAAGTSALLPMLSLGVPGSPTAAVLLGGLLIWGLQPGPLLFVEQNDFVWGLIASMYLGNLVGLIIVLTMVPLFAAILRIPFSIIAPIILVICAIGAYTVHNSTFDVVMMLVFGVVGYLLKKTDYPLAPMVLAIVLGDKAEEAFRQSLLASRGSLGVFLSNPLVGTHHGARPDRAVLAADPGRLRQVPGAADQGGDLTGRQSPTMNTTELLNLSLAWNIVFQYE